MEPSCAALGFQTRHTAVKGEANALECPTTVDRPHGEREERNDEEKQATHERGRSTNPRLAKKNGGTQ
jgi:hypothetical protein